MILANADQGSGSVVLLIHSGICDRRMWIAQVAALSDIYRVITADLRGFGETPLPPGEYSNADDVATLLDHLDVERCAFVGSSLGGRVALEVAVTHPERVASLLLLCPAFRGAGTTPSVEAFGAAEDRLLNGGNVDAAVELNVSTWLGPDATEECRDLVREMQKRAFEIQLAAESITPEPEATPIEVNPAQVSVPTVVVSGGRDMDHFQNVALYLATSIPGARLHGLPWAAHLPNLERPSEVNTLILEALEDTVS